MKLRRVALASLLIVVSACSALDLIAANDPLSDRWMAFDPCELGDPATAASLLGVDSVTTRVMLNRSLMDNDFITGKSCMYETRWDTLIIFFKEGGGSMDQGGRLIDLPGVGDEAILVTNDGEYGPKHEGEVHEITIDVEGMNVVVSGGDFMEGTPETDELIEFARIAADRMRAEVLSQ